MTDRTDEDLRSIFYSAVLDHHDPQFTAHVLYRIGARRRRERYLTLGLIAFGTAVPVMVIVSEIIQTLAAANAGLAPTAAGILFLLSLALAALTLDPAATAKR